MNELHYIESGADNGRVMLLLHGNGEDGGYFGAQLGFFGSRYHVIAPDTPGQGESPRGEGEYTLGRFADDLCDFMDAHNIDKAVLLGFSDGANIALCFALKYPSRVERLILNGGNLDPSGVKPSVQLPIIIGWRIARLFSRFSEGAKAKTELLGLMVEQPHIDPRELHKIKIPTLVIAGTRDMIKDSHTRLIAASIPGAKLKILEGDHFIANRAPRHFNLAVEEFLDGRD